jgi:hypothetical protein
VYHTENIDKKKLVWCLVLRIPSLQERDHLEEKDEFLDIPPLFAALTKKIMKTSDLTRTVA